MPKQGVQINDLILFNRIKIRLQTPTRPCRSHLNVRYHAGRSFWAMGNAQAAHLYQNVTREYLGITGESILRHYPTARAMRGVAISRERPPTETKMQKAALIILGAWLIAGSSIQMAAASEHHARAGRGRHHWDRTYNQWQDPSYAAPQQRDDYGKPPPSESRTCDIKWCYAD
jgi:hypothetical protein